MLYPSDFRYKIITALGILVLASCAQGNGVPADTDGGSGFADAGAADSNPDAVSAESCDESTCFPGVVCSDQGQSPSCGDCPVGMEGDGTQCSDIDACAMTPCADNVTCTDQGAPSTGFDCGECPSGFFGNGVICTDVDSCSGTPCFPGVACTDSAPPEVGFSCGACPTGYEGDGLSCNDIDGCVGNPCFAGVTCTDAVAPQMGFSCGSCPMGTQGDGVTCAAGCTPVGAIGCAAAINASNTGAGSANVTTDWGCTAVNLSGSEIVYSFVPDGDGIATATLSGLSADLDLLVIKDSAVPGTCEATDNTVCIPNGYSGNTNSTDELVRWNADAGATYYIIVDAFQAASSNFTLEVSTSFDDILLMEVALGTDDFVELRNFGACDVDIAGLTVMHRASLDSTAENFTFAANTNVGPQGIIRRMEPASTPFAANEIDGGINIPDLPEGAGFTALCEGSCDLVGCANLLDYVERKDAIDQPAGPACANFGPSPIDSAGQTGELSLQRSAFDGAAGPNDFKAGDWVFGATTRD